ncbi:MAG: acetyl-CoA carboxylase biotin carboxyl carrier protein [bacterium]|nr:acetyl-CoA carboxylase biotin carboxyl carrier protein [bacterium]
MIFKDIDIKQLFQLMQEHEVADLTLKDGKTEVIIKRHKILSDNAEIDSALNPASISETISHPTSEEPVEDETGKELAAKEEPSDNYHSVVAPLVGTFYRSPSPEANAFVEVGDRVNSGDVLCIVEAMKSMNEIQSDAGGIIKEICIDNAELVEFNQVLFKIDTSA